MSTKVAPTPGLEGASILLAYATKNRTVRVVKRNKEHVCAYRIYSFNSFLMPCSFQGVQGCFKCCIQIPSKTLPQHSTALPNNTQCSFFQGALEAITAEPMASINTKHVIGFAEAQSRKIYRQLRRAQVPYVTIASYRLARQVT